MTTTHTHICSECDLESEDCACDYELDITICYPCERRLAQLDITEDED